MAWERGIVSRVLLGKEGWELMRKCSCGEPELQRRDAAERWNPDAPGALRCLSKAEKEADTVPTGARPHKRRRSASLPHLVRSSPPSLPSLANPPLIPHSCGLLDGGTFTAYLTTVKTWLDANPNEVVTLLLVNSAGILPSVWAASYVAAGLDTLSYTPPSVPITYEAWPTLQELITSGKRVVSFLAQNADVSTAPFLIDQFTNIWETPFGVSILLGSE